MDINDEKYSGSLILPSKKLVSHIDDIVRVGNVMTYRDDHDSPVKEWHEFNIFYKNNKSVTYSYEVFSTAANDRVFLIRSLNKV